MGTVELGMMRREWGRHFPWELLWQASSSAAHERSGMPDDDLHAVREMPLFATMSDEHFDNLLQGAQLQHFSGSGSTDCRRGPSRFSSHTGAGNS